jgi:sugar lactone lactonase YvrE
VSSYADGSISRIESNGKISRIVRGGLTAPGGLALLENAGGAAKGGTDVEVVVADVQSIRGFDGKSGVQRLLQRSVFGTGQMGSVTNVAPDGANLILSSWLDGTVTVWDPTARRVVSRTPDLAQPVSAIRYGRWIVVAEYGKGRVIAISPSDPLKTVLFVSGLPAPTGLAVRNGDLFVTDRVRGEILRIASGGVPVRRAAAVASGLASPEGIAATPTGFVVVEGDTGRLIEIDTHGQVRVVETIPGGTREAPTSMQPPSMIFNGVAVSREGVIYATGEKSRALYRIDPH